jgi:hypothetical protein
MNDPQLAGVIVNCVVHGTAVVPEDNVVPPPAMTEGELVSGGVRNKTIQERLTLVDCLILQTDRACAAVEKRFAFGRRVRPNQRMHGLMRSVRYVSINPPHASKSSAGAMHRK